MKFMAEFVLVAMFVAVVVILAGAVHARSREENALVRRVRFQTTTGELIECRVRLQYPMERLSCELVK